MMSSSCSNDVDSTTSTANTINTTAYGIPEQQDENHVTVIGVGAMGSGIFHALLRSQRITTVTAYDQNMEAVQSCHNAAVMYQKAAMVMPPTILTQAILPDNKTNYVMLVLQNEMQCASICFGNDARGDTSASLNNRINKNKNNNDDSTTPPLYTLLRPGSCVLLHSTVTATFAQHASRVFWHTRGIHFIDCPVSGGPARAKAGDLTLMGSCDHYGSWNVVAHPIVHALSGGTPDRMYYISGGAGMGSTIKMVHQLLAGVHIVAAAEALSLAAKAGLDLDQLYEIVTGAAGASWMFVDRVPRMMRIGCNATPTSAQDELPIVPVKSQLQIFVKDLDIVYSEAKRLQCPIPLATSALQQFIAGQSLGLSQQDDSQVVQVYEKLNGTACVSSSASAAVSVSSLVLPTSTSNPYTTQDPVVDNVQRREGSNVGEFWTMEDGTVEVIVEVAKEPRHHLVLKNNYVRALRVSFPPNDTTLVHRHDQDSLYFFLVPGGAQVLNHVQGNASLPCADCMTFGEVRFGAHRSVGPPLVHRITNQSDQPMLCIDAELLQRPPITAVIPLMAPHHELIKTRDTCRVYKLTLEPGALVKVTYSFYHFTVVVEGSTIQREINAPGGSLRWTETSEMGDIAWKEPVVDLQKTNIGNSTFVEYIAEWR